MPIVHSTVNVASGRHKPSIPELAELLEGNAPIDPTSINSWEEAAFVAAVRGTGRDKLIFNAIGRVPRASHTWSKSHSLNASFNNDRAKMKLTVHPLSHEDSPAATALRAAVAPFKGRLEGTAARGPFDDVMERVVAPVDVTFKADTVGGISGFWAKPARSQKGAAILHLHGGWFNFGTARAYRNLVGHIASRAGANAFIPDYRLAPEHPFPAAITDVEACYRGLVDKGIDKIALVGDSAGGDLALVLLSIARDQVQAGDRAPVGAVAISPVTDLAVTGESYETRAEADPYFTKSQAAVLVASYLGGSDPKNPLASPLYGDLSRLPPIRVHVGDDEVLLDDSRRYVERAVAAGVDAELDVWMGMPHGFVTAIREFDAARQSLSAIGAFLAERLLQDNTDG